MWIVGSPPTHCRYLARARGRPRARSAKSRLVSSVPRLGIEGIGLADAEEAAEVAARKIEEQRGDEFDFLAALHATAIDAGLGCGLAESAFAPAAIDAATVLAEQAIPVFLRCPLQFPGANRLT